MTPEQWKLSVKNNYQWKKKKKPGCQASVRSSGVGINIGDGNSGGRIATVNDNWVRYHIWKKKKKTLRIEMWRVSNLIRLVSCIMTVNAVIVTGSSCKGFSLNPCSAEEVIITHRDLNICAIKNSCILKLKSSCRWNRFNGPVWIQVLRGWHVEGRGGVSEVKEGLSWLYH